MTTKHVSQDCLTTFDIPDIAYSQTELTNLILSKFIKTNNVYSLTLSQKKLFGASLNNANLIIIKKWINLLYIKSCDYKYVSYTFSDEGAEITSISV
jgi:hypothetical protein